MVKRKISSLFYLTGSILILYILFINLRASAFFQAKDRLNLVFSGDKISFYSLGLDDKVNYFVSFFPDLEAVVPGGYGYYRLGALAKLSSLEKNPDLFKNTYSALTFSMIDYYFYPSSSSNRMEIFFGKENNEFSLPRYNLLIFGESNAYFFDRLYIFFQLFSKSKGQFKMFNSYITENQSNRITISSKTFFEDQKGIFYKKTYRTEQRSVQIVYTSSYKTAKLISQIMEGEGIRVVDLNQESKNTPLRSSSYAGQGKNCEVVEDNKRFSETAKSVSRFFGCQLSFGKTEAYDIILRLGQVEKKWEVE